MDYALVNLGITIALAVATFAFRKRILTALGRLLFDGAVKFARATFLVEDVVEAEDGTKRARIRLSAPAIAIVEAAAPAFIAAVAKSIKIKPGAAGASPLPEGLDLSNLSASLPALLGSGLIPKKYAGIVAILAPFLQGFMGGASKPAEGKAGTNPFLKELGP